MKYRFFLAEDIYADLTQEQFNEAPIKIIEFTNENKKIESKLLKNNFKDKEYYILVPINSFEVLNEQI